MGPCSCYFGRDCTKTTLCAVESAVEDATEELERRIEELESGRCRFNCRTQREAFEAGWRAYYDGIGLKDAYKKWAAKNG